MPEFFLGTHLPAWLGYAGVPLFISDTRLRRRKTLPRAVAPWACDSGGFSELKQHGRWTVTPESYVQRLRRYHEEIGYLLWAAPQDWMCEPAIIEGGRVAGQHYIGTRRFLDPDRLFTHEELIVEHQRRTVANFVQLRELAPPDLRIMPVVQGWEPDDYVRCVDLYQSMAGVDLTTQPLVGVGSVCRRQGMTEAGQVLAALHRRGVTRLHGFGFKTLGMHAHGHLLTTADSMAWSDTARKHRVPMPGCDRSVKNCANCLHFALHWRAELLDQLAANTVRPVQPTLWEAA
jgi:hypothetical protein